MCSGFREAGIHGIVADKPIDSDGCIVSGFLLKKYLVLSPLFEHLLRESSPGLAVPYLHLTFDL